MQFDISSGFAVELLSLNENTMLLLIFVIDLSLFAVHFQFDVNLYFLATLVDEIGHVTVACEMVEQETINYVFKEYVFVEAAESIFQKPVCLKATRAALLVSNQTLNCFLNELVSLLNRDPQFLSLRQPIIENDDRHLVYQLLKLLATQ